MITKLKALLKKKSVRYAVTAVLIFAVIVSGFSYFKGHNGDEETAKTTLVRQVKAITLNRGYIQGAGLELPGSVKAQNTIDVVAQTAGTVKSLDFEVGDIVDSSKTLASLSDNTTLVSFNNTQTNVTNQQNNLNAIKRITDESIRQAEIGIDSAGQSVQSAETAVKAAKDNYNSAKVLREKSNLDIKNNAIITFNGYLNTIYTTLDSIDYIIDADADGQLPGISNILGVKDVSSVSTAKSSYRTAKNSYTDLSGTLLNIDNIESNIGKMVTSLSLLKKSLDDVVYVLDNSITSAAFPESSLSAQKAAFTALRTTIVNSQSSAESSQQTLNNLSLISSQELTALENAISAAENQLAIAKTNEKNSNAFLDNAKQSKEQQILGVQSALDNAQGQMRLSQSQVSDLTVRAPISGTITKKYVEVGAEVSPGQKIAEVSQTDAVIIEVDVQADDLDKIKNGQEVEINPGTTKLVGTVNRVYPTADPSNRKVRVEIAFDNKNGELIPQSFVNVKIPNLNDSEEASENFYIPLRAVTIAQNESYVFLAQGETAVRTKVDLGRTEGKEIEVIGGLGEGDTLIIEGNRALAGGEAVTVAFVE